MAAHALQASTELTVAQVAELTGYNARHVRRLVDAGNIPATQRLNERNRPAYYIPLAALEPKLQRRYLKGAGGAALAAGAPPTAAPGAAKPLEQYTAAEREEILFWINTLQQWQDYRGRHSGAGKMRVDEAFVAWFGLEHPDVAISEQILYRKLRAYKAEDMDGLLDKRGKWRKGQTDMPEVLLQAFLTYYLDEARHPVTQCIKFTRAWAQEMTPELLDAMPSYQTFRRRAQELAEPVKVMGRGGEKEYYDRCSLYIRRTYEDMEANEWWVADNHTFDVQSQDENGRIHRLHLTAFFDARSGIFTGCFVTDNPCSQATLIALRKGILAYGKPKNIYVDNGSEFLTFDVGGRGHRTRKSQRDVFQPPPVFQRLGIHMCNALVANARAKVIERRFKDIKDQLSRLFNTYTGGNVTERPNRLKKVLKDGNIPTDNRLTEVVEELLEYHFNEATYGGAVVRDRGKRRIDIFHEHLERKTVVPEDELNLLLMRSSHLQTVGRRGVLLKIGDVTIDYFNEALRMLQGKKVYLRYDPENLDTVRVYDTDDRFVMEAPRDNKLLLPYGAGADDVKEANRQVRRAAKVVKEAVQASILPVHSRITALELVLAQAGAAKAARLLPPSGPQAIELYRETEQPLLQAVGHGMDLSRMVENAVKKGNQKED